YFNPKPLPPAIIDWVRAVGLKLSLDYAEVAGGIVAKNTTQGAIGFGDLAKAHEPLLKRLEHPLMSAQPATVIARCSALPRLNHAMRTTLPSYTSDGTKWFDYRIREALSSKIDTPPDS